MHTHVRVCACEFAAHTQISSEILSILVLMSWNTYQKKKNQAAQGMAGGMGWGHPTLCGAAKPEQDALCVSVSLLVQA